MASRKIIHIERYSNASRRALLMLGLSALFSPMCAGQNLFDQLNLQLPSLSSVRAAVQQKDRKTAELQLLRYFQNRTNRVFSRFVLRGDSAQAYQNSRNRFLLRAQLVDFGKTINWRTTGIDREWNYSLNRMGWLVDYAGVYDVHPDEHLVQAFVDQVQSWIRQAESPGFPRSIDTGNRLYHWCVAHWYFIQRKQSPSITPEFNAEMLRSMAAQAEFLYAPEHWRRFSNWGTFENSGLAFFALMFPEFKRSKEWLNEIRFRVYFQLTHSYHADGVHTEVSPSYHSREMEVLLGIIQAAEDNGISLSVASQVPIPSLKTLLTAPAEALLYLLRPNGTTPNVGDTDEDDKLGILRELSHYLQRKDLLYVATRGRAGTVPNRTSVAFPQGGYYVMRSGWGSVERPIENEMYLLFDCGTNRPWHAHYDQLNIVADANGAELLKDAGRYTYNDDADRAYFKGTAAHNTIVIDSVDQPQGYSPEQARWISSEGFDYVSGVNTSNNKASHRRSVFFVKPEYWIVADVMAGTGLHRYEQFWHLSKASEGLLTYDTQTNQLKTAAMVLASAPSEAKYTLEEAWFSPRYRERVKAPMLKRTENRAGEFTWSTVIYPYKERMPEFTVEHLSVVSDKSSRHQVALKIAHRTGDDYYFERDSLDRTSLFGAISTDGSLLFLRTDSGGSVPAFFLAEGSYVIVGSDTLAVFSHRVASATLSNGMLSVDTPCPVTLVVHGDSVRNVRVNQKQVEYRREGNNVRYEENYRRK